VNGKRGLAVLRIGIKVPKPKPPPINNPVPDIKLGPIPKCGE
jgi:hypothetical protein